MFVIGMMTFTAFASTPMPEKNQKAPIQLKYASIEIVADVLPINVLTVVSEGSVFVSYDALFITGKNYEPLKHFAIIVDVGWSFSPEQYKKVPYLEKLNSAYRTDHEKNLQKLGITNARNNC